MHAWLRLPPSPLLLPAAAALPLPYLCQSQSLLFVVFVVLFRFLHEFGLAPPHAADFDGDDDDDENDDNDDDYDDDDSPSPPNP